MSGHWAMFLSQRELFFLDQEMWQPEFGSQTGELSVELWIAYYYYLQTKSNNLLTLDFLSKSTQDLTLPQTGAFKLGWVRRIMWGVSMLCKHYCFNCCCSSYSRRLPWPQLNVTLCVYCMLYYILWTRRCRVVFSDSDLGVFLLCFSLFALFWHGVKTDMLVILSNPCVRLWKSGSEDVYQLRWS